MTMASRWSQHEAPGSRGADDDLPSPDSPAPPNTGRSSGTQASSERSSAPSWQEPPALDDSCVKYILSVMVLFMRQTATPDQPLMLHTRSTDISFRDYEEESATFASLGVDAPVPSAPPPTGDIPLRTRQSVNSVKSGRLSIHASIHLPATNTTYEKTHGSFVKSARAVNSLIAKYVGRIVFHISASNWNVVFDRLASKITFLAAHMSENANPDVVDLNLISYSVLDRQRLVALLNREFLAELECAVL